MESRGTASAWQSVGPPLLALLLAGLTFASHHITSHYITFVVHPIHRRKQQRLREDAQRESEALAWKLLLQERKKKP